MIRYGTGSIDLQMIIEQELDMEQEVGKHLLDTKELQEDLEAVGLESFIIDEDTDFDSPEFQELGNMLKNE